MQTGMQTGMQTTESPYFDYTQAAAYCNVDRTTLWRATRSKTLRPSGPGRAIRFHRDELDRWMASRSR
jgi:excisionase family DNA binding protein